MSDRKAEGDETKQSRKVRGHWQGGELPPYFLIRNERNRVTARAVPQLHTSVKNRMLKEGDAVKSGEIIET